MSPASQQHGAPRQPRCPTRPPRRRSTPPAGPCSCRPSAPKPIAMADAAAKQRLSHKAFLADVLTAECDERDARRRLRRVNEAKFPRTKRLADFDTTSLPDLPAATLGHLADRELDRRRRTAWSCSATPAPGKPICSSRLGTAAAEHGRRVRYVTTAALVNELVEAADDKQLSRVVGPLRPPGSALPRRDRIRQARCPRRRTAVQNHHCARGENLDACASNAPFSEWGTTFTDPRLAAAVVDRLTFHAHIIQPARGRTGSTPPAKPGTEPVNSAVNTGERQPNQHAGWGQIKTAQWGQMGLSFSSGR